MRIGLRCVQTKIISQLFGVIESDVSNEMQYYFEY
jgi:hypothetical protein